MLETLNERIDRWFEHGLNVHRCFGELIKNPEMTNDKKAADLICVYEPFPGIEHYHINHDMSKPYIVEMDDQGRMHYPNHSIQSAQMYREKFGPGIIPDLIERDMLFHTLRGNELIELWKYEHATHLYITAWAELFANAALFGGIESDSFKIKRKRLLSALKCLC